MWLFRKTARQRRLEARRTPHPGGSVWTRFRRAGGIGACVLAGALYVCVVLMDLWPVHPFLYRAGQYLPHDVHARVAFGMPSSELIEDEKRRARNATPAVFVLDDSRVEEIVSELRKLPRRSAAATQPAQPVGGAPPPAAGDANRLPTWRAYADDPNAAQRFRQQVDAVAEGLRRCYVVDKAAPEKQKPLWREPDRVVLRLGAADLASEFDSLAGPADEAVAAEAAKLAAPFDEPIRPAVQALLLTALRAQPLYRYDPRATQQLMDAAVAAIEAEPPDHVLREYKAGEKIIDRTRPEATGEPAAGLTAEKLQVLRAEHEAFQADRRARPVGWWLRAAGRGVLLLLIVAVLAIYVARYEPALTDSPRRAIALLGWLAVLLAVHKVTTGAFLLNPYVSVLPVATAAAILTIAWNQRFALAVGSALALLVVLQVRGSMALFLVQLAALSATVFQLDEIRTRTKLIRVAAVAAGAALLAVWVLSLAAAVPWRFALIDAVWAAGAALLSGFVVQGLLPLIERTFHVATSLTLLEWCDASRPLLKRLAMEAPGTYNHSLQLGAMCESAAEAIGAGGLLARVGAYYHDIGKVHKPDYFVENQAGPGSRHENLSPAMSLLIIIGHVKDGIEMAREYGLPKVLHEFIATHHGTTLVQYFYQAATEQRKDDTDRAPDEMEFRYPGPKPRSKEAAILVLADAAESSVRAMGEPTPGRIENQVHAMVSRRLMDGQLDDCELTLRQVHQIETSLIKSLCSVYHARIAYPTPPGERPAASERHPKRPPGANGPKADTPAPDAPDARQAPADGPPAPQQADA